MQDRIYILSIREFLEESGGEELMARALDKVDESRRVKAERIKQQRAKAASLGAGLLLQLAVRDFRGLSEDNLKRNCAERVLTDDKESPDIHSNSASFTVSQALTQIKQPLPLEFTCGKSGKPYFKEYPFYFNLSHSGDYVVCVISQQEIGVDIQEHRCGNLEKIANRYFTAQEVHMIQECGLEQQQQTFFDLWAAKEAYGKYTGGGITESLEWEVPVDRVALQTLHNIPGYSLVICKAI